MGSLFEKAKKKAEGTTTKSGKQKAEVVLSNDADFAAIKRLQELNEQIASLEAEKAIVYGDVRQLGVDQFVKKYTEENRFTDSFKIVVRNKIFITLNIFKRSNESCSFFIIFVFNEQY